MMNPVGAITELETARVEGINAPSSAGFEKTFASVATAARDTMRAGEAAAISGIQGDTSVQDVVQALMGAEEQLRAAIAVRDRVVAAYQEISRMQI